MKKIIFISSVILFLCCKNKTTDISSNEEHSDSVRMEKLKNAQKINDSIKIHSFKNCDETFEEFFKEFAKDSIFQVSRIKYPLKWKYLNDVTDNELTIELVKYGSFNYIDFTNDEVAYKNEYSKYSVDIDKSNEHILYTLHGIDNGIHVIYKFNLIEDCWYLVEILDEST
jgi:hypothetical protein